VKHAALWLLGGGVALVAGYELFFADTHVPAGYVGIKVAPGSIRVAAGTPADSSPNIAFVLPKGGRWNGAGRSPAPGAAQLAVPLPHSTSAPILVTGVSPGAGFLLAWTDAQGAVQTTIYAFA
jgi:hypothetical protein